MKVEVKLYGWFREYLPASSRGKADVDLAGRATVSDLLAHLGIDAHVDVVLVNSVPTAGQDLVLSDSDMVEVSPIFLGG